MDSLWTGVIVVLVGQFITILFTLHTNRGSKIEDLIKSVIRLETKMELVLKAIESLPKLKQDVNEAHKKLRESVNGRIKNQ